MAASRGTRSASHSPSGPSRVLAMAGCLLVCTGQHHQVLNRVTPKGPRLIGPVPRTGGGCIRPDLNGALGVVDLHNDSRLDTGRRIVNRHRVGNRGANGDRVPAPVL